MSGRGMKEKLLFNTFQGYELANTAEEPVNDR